MHLGNRPREVELNTGVWCWAFWLDPVCQHSRDVCSGVTGLSGRTLPRRAEAPSRLSIGQIDVSWECQVRKRPIYCQSSIGMNAAIESWAWSGRYLLGFSMMRSRHLAQSIERHLEYLFHLFAYLGKYQNAEMLYDPIVPCITSAAFQKQDWTYSIHYAGEG